MSKATLAQLSKSTKSVTDSAGQVRQQRNFLENLRNMAVFAYVVERRSFSAAARDLGVTTSAVSQQIRALEEEMGIVLMHRSTRKLSLTESGEAFYQSCQEMVEAAEQGRSRVNELRDDVVGDLRIATTPELCVNHIVPALSQWMQSHPQLNIHFEVENKNIDLIESRIDIALRMSPGLADSSMVARPLFQVNQILCASPEYLARYAPIKTPEDLQQHTMIAMELLKEPSQCEFIDPVTGKRLSVLLNARLFTNNVFLMKSLCTTGQGLMRVLHIDVQKELANGELIEVLPEWPMPGYTLYALTLRRERQPLKVTRCLEALLQHFSQLPIRH